MKIIILILLSLCSMQTIAQNGFVYEQDTLWLYRNDARVARVNPVSGTAAFSTITGQPSDNANLTTVLDAKLSTATAAATYLPKTVTAGVGTCPTATGTQTITHNLGRTPTTIRIFGKGRFTSNAAATPTPSSDGIWCSSGNFCIYQTTAGTTTSNPLSSDVFSVFIATSSGNTISGVIQNVGAATFEIEWSETGASAALPFLWQAQ